jgi:hypothetical protein
MIDAVRNGELEELFKLDDGNQNLISVPNI